MHATIASAKPRGLALMLGWRRVRFTLVLSAIFGLMLGLGAGPLSMLIRTVMLGLVCMLVSGCSSRLSP